MHATTTSYEDDSRDRSMLDLGASTIRLVTTVPTPPTPPSPPLLHPFTPTFEPSNSPKSPLHCISNNEFTSAAASVLAEMNARLGLTGTSNEVGLDLFQKRYTQETAPLPELQARPRTELTSMFDRAHERQFQKMEGLGEWYARRNAASLGKPVLQEISANRKRKSDVLDDPHKKPIGTANVHAKRTSKAITPGKRCSLIAASSETEDTDERKMKKVRINLIDGGDKKVGVAANNKSQDKFEEDDMAKSNEERERERAAIKKKLEISRFRRRSSMGRVSVSGGRTPLIQNQAKKGMSIKFGFLSSAKSIVKNVWKGVGSGTLKQNSTMPLTRRSQATVPPATKKTTPNVLATSAPATKTSNSKTPVVKASTLTPGPHASLRIPARGIGLGKKISTKVGTNSTATTRSSTVPSRTHSISSSSVSGVPAGRRGAIPSFQQPSSLMSRKNCLANVGGTLGSSSGTGSSRGSFAANSIGMIKAGIPSSTRSSDVANGSTNSAKRTSTLFAPTASSLAKMQSTVRPPSFSKATSRPSSNALAKVQAQKPPVRDGLPTSTFTSSPLAGDGPNKAIGSIFSNGSSTFHPSQGPTSDARVPKPRVPPARRPRISRSHVIARVGAQRAGSGSSLTRTNSGRRSFNAPKTRGSFSVRVSGIGAKNHARDSAAMNTRKRLRQSEILRRRSKLSEVSPALSERDCTSSDGDGDGSEGHGGASIDVPMES